MICDWGTAYSTSLASSDFALYASVFVLKILTRQFLGLSVIQMVLLHLLVLFLIRCAYWRILRSPAIRMTASHRIPMCIATWLILRHSGFAHIMWTTSMHHAAPTFLSTNQIIELSHFSVGCPHTLERLHMTLRLFTEISPTIHRLLVRISCAKSYFWFLIEHYFFSFFCRISKDFPQFLLLFRMVQCRKCRRLSGLFYTWEFCSASRNWILATFSHIE